MSEKRCECLHHQQLVAAEAEIERLRRVITESSKNAVSVEESRAEERERLTEENERMRAAVRLGIECAEVAARPAWQRSADVNAALAEAEQREAGGEKCEACGGKAWLERGPNIGAYTACPKCNGTGSKRRGGEV